MARSTCACCGQPAVHARNGLVTGGPVCANAWCADPRRPLSVVYGASAYRGELRKAIVAYKYGGDLRWARPFAGLLYSFLARHETWFEEVGVLCPIPSFTGAGAARTWGHIELVCREMAALCQPWWPVQELMAKTAATEPMCRQTWPGRVRTGSGQLANAFVVPRPELVAGSHVLLVDDVCASGSTLLAAAAALRRAGAAEVAGLVLARATWRGEAARSLGEA